MRWDTVTAAIVAGIAADSDIQSVFGASPAFTMAGDRDHAIPSLEYSIIPGGEHETFETAMIQLDFWVRSFSELVTVERALRALLHADLPITMGGVRLWSTFDGSQRLEGAREGTFTRSLDFRLEFLREVYA